MKWFYNFNVAKKMASLIVLFAIFLAVVGYVGYRDLLEANDELEAMYHENLIPVQLITDNRNQLRGVMVNLLEMMLTTDDNEKKRLLSNIQERAKSYNDNITLLEKAHMDAQQKKLMQEAGAIMAQYRAKRDAVIALAMENKNAEAYQLYVKEIRPVAETANGKMRELGQYTEKKAQKTLEEDEKDVAAALKFLIGLIAGSLVVVAVLGRIITRIIANPLKRVAAVASEVAGGNLAVGQIAIESTDEVGQLASAINQMVNNLRHRHSGWRKRAISGS